MQLSVINGGKRPSINYYELYHNAYLRILRDAIDKEEFARENTYKAIFYGVKLFGLKDFEETTNIEGVLALMDSVKYMIRLLTPNELMRIFPVEKTYDGDRWGSKDYFYTMDVLCKHGLDTPIGDAIEEIIWDYTNKDIRNFHVNWLCIISKLHRSNTGRGMVSEFFESVGEPVTEYTEVTDTRTGKKYVQNNDTGQMQRIRKPMPKHMRVVNGGVR